MTSDILRANDLRHTGTQAKRFHDHKAKWAYGGRSARLRTPVCDASPIARPNMPRSHYTTFSRALRLHRQAETNHLITGAKIDLRCDIREALDSSSGSGGINTTGPSAAPTSSKVQVVDRVDRARNEGDEVVPSSSSYDVVGQTVLSDAINKAVEKFEVRETERLVRTYEMVAPEEDGEREEHADDEGFELVDRVVL